MLVLEKCRGSGVKEYIFRNLCQIRNKRNVDPCQCLHKKVKISILYV